MGDMKIKAGAGRATIRLPEIFFPYEGFAGFHDDLCVRVLLLDNGATRAAIAIVDLTSIRNPGDFIRTVSGEANIDAENIFLCASHTFEAPHIIPDDQIVDPVEREKSNALVSAVTEALAMAARSAKESLRPCRYGFGLGICDVNVNRDVKTRDGWWKGQSEDGPSDKTVSILKFETSEGDPIAFFVNYPVQPCVLLDSVPDDGKKKVSADLAGATARLIECEYGEKAIALWNIGAAGDQNPSFLANRFCQKRSGEIERSDIHGVGNVVLDMLAERLAHEAVRVIDSIRCTGSTARLLTAGGTVVCPGQEVFGNVHAMRPTRTYDYKPTAPISVPYFLLVIGDVALIGVQVELVCRTAMRIKSSSPFKNTVIMTMVNGAAKYLPDSVSYDRIAYAAMNSTGAKGSAELLAEAIEDRLNEMVFR